MGKKRTLTDESKWGYILIAPTIIGLIVLNVYPFIQTLILSFSATHPFGIYEITGPQNYVRMFESREFWKATWNSIYFCILTVPAGLFLSLITAVLLNAKLKGKTAFLGHLLSSHGGGSAAIAHGMENGFSTLSTASSIR